MADELRLVGIRRTNEHVTTRIYSDGSELVVPVETRHGDWIRTYSGIAFWPVDPRMDEINIVDIAHALSNQCRWTGHTKYF